MKKFIDYGRFFVFKKMKILLFANRFAFEYSIELANNLSLKNNISKVMLMLPNNKLDEFQRSQISDLVHFHPFEAVSDSNIIGSLEVIRDIRRIIVNEKPDIFHMQGSGNFYFLFLYPFLKKIKIIDTIHDAQPHPGFDRLRTRLMRWNTLRNTNHWFTHGENLKNKMVGQYSFPREKITVIPKGHYGIFKNYSSDIHQEELNSVLFFGNITKYKGLEYLIKAEPLISHYVKDLKITIAGKIANGRSKDANSELKRYVKLMENKNRFKILNQRVPSNLVPELFQKASLIIMPYVEASQSGVLSIAFGFGKAVVITDVGALSEIVKQGKTGYIVEPRNVGMLALAIIKLFKNSNIKNSFEAESYAYAKNELSWERVTDITVAKYFNILN
mgnify:CR=1 FL=1